MRTAVFHRMDPFMTPPRLFRSDCMTYASSKFNVQSPNGSSRFNVQCSRFREDVRVFKTFKLFNRCAPFKSFRAEASVQRSKVELFKVCASRRYLRRVFEAKKRFGLSVRNYMVTSSHVHLLVNDTGANFIA